MEACTETAKSGYKTRILMKQLLGAGRREASFTRIVGPASSTINDRSLRNVIYTQYDSLVPCVGFSLPQRTRAGRIAGRVLTVETDVVVSHPSYDTPYMTCDPQMPHRDSSPPPPSSTSLGVAAPGVALLILKQTSRESWKRSIFLCSTVRTKPLARHSFSKLAINNSHYHPNSSNPIPTLKMQLFLSTLAFTLLTAFAQAAEQESSCSMYYLPMPTAQQLMGQAVPSGCSISSATTKTSTISDCSCSSTTTVTPVSSSPWPFLCYPLHVTNAIPQSATCESDSNNKVKRAEQENQPSNCPSASGSESVTVTAFVCKKTGTTNDKVKRAPLIAKHRVALEA